MTLAAWFSVILEDAGLVPTQASLVFSYAYVGAMIAIVILARLIDFFGPRAAIISASIAGAGLIYLGTPGLGATAITVVAILSLAVSSATHQSLNGIVGGFYPTIVRGNGVGYASGMGRAAAIIGPLIAGSLLAAKLPLQAVLASIAAPYLVVAVVCLALDRLQRRMTSESKTDAPADAAMIQPALSPHP
jgi:AAHS family 4-hydroxybenzoate transporter-like MFS transporter